jgi:hypothetical protein
VLCYPDIKLRFILRRTSVQMKGKDYDEETTYKIVTKMFGTGRTPGFIKHKIVSLVGLPYYTVQ